MVEVFKILRQRSHIHISIYVYDFVIACFILFELSALRGIYYLFTHAIWVASSTLGYPMIALVPVKQSQRKLHHENRTRIWQYGQDKSKHSKIRNIFPWLYSILSSKSHIVGFIMPLQTLRPVGLVCTRSTSIANLPSLIKTHWGRDKTADISQTTFSNVFSSKQMFEFRSKFHWSLLLRVQLTKFQHCFR